MAQLACLLRPSLVGPVPGFWAVDTCQVLRETHRSYDANPSGWNSLSTRTDPPISTPVPTPPKIPHPSFLASRSLQVAQRPRLLSRISRPEANENPHTGQEYCKCLRIQVSNIELSTNDFGKTSLLNEKRKTFPVIRW